MKLCVYALLTYKRMHDVDQLVIRQIRDSFARPVRFLETVKWLQTLCNRFKKSAIWTTNRSDRSLIT